MYKTGHIGMALLLYSPLGLVVLLAGSAELAVLGGTVVVSLASLPDYDQRVPFIAHRGPTHSVAFAAVVGLALGLGGIAMGEHMTTVAAARVGVFAFAVGTLAVVSHLVADSITPMGIRPLWPVSRWHYSANLVRAKNPIANHLLLAVGIAAVVGALVVGGELA